MARELRHGKTYWLPDGKQVIALRTEQPDGNGIWSLQEVEGGGRWEALPNGQIIEHPIWVCGVPVEENLDWIEPTPWFIRDLFPEPDELSKNSGLEPDRMRTCLPGR